ncbi:hypothetical protein [Methylocystis heyeri]|uniref:Sodium:solute symporter n=1 Tax=Methylocystis heyeri TaxID=391905 RepID=A0A6B8KG25_9HYPH|nr:hypothetical protein [Methylocystis heyeri]QGM45945.1 hypothetical protein H2LOC_009650 [Methylocystis heyeri]
MTDAPDDDGAEREKLDARIAFVAAAFILAFSFVLLLDRVGAPSAFVEALAPCLAIVSLAALGAALHSMRVSFYYTAGRGAPPEYAGFAKAALVAGFMAPFAAWLASRSWLIGLCGGLFAGVALAGWQLGPMLRKSGAFSLSGLLAVRFPGLWPRVAVIALECATSALVALAAQQSAVDALVGASGAGPGLAAVIVGAGMLFIAGPGGMFGSIWTACAAGAVALASLCWPALTLALRGVAPFGRSSGSLAREAAAQLEAWGAVAPFPGYGLEFMAVVGAALGAAVLAPLLAPAITTARPAQARVSGLFALGWTFVFAWLLAAIVAGTALSMTAKSVGQAPERLPGAVYAASSRGLVAVCGDKAPDPQSARRACAARGLAPGAGLRTQDFSLTRSFLLTGLADLEKLGAAASGLLAAAQIALALALGAAGLQAFGTALGHEALYRMRGETDLTSRRLATTRLALVSIAALGSAASAYGLFDPRQLLELALGLSAAAVAPLAILAFWTRADGRDAMIALGSGLVGTILVVGAAGGPADIELVSAAAAVGALLGLAAGALSALSRPAGPQESKAFVSRLLRGEGDVMSPDKGA